MVTNIDAVFSSLLKAERPGPERVFDKLIEDLELGLRRPGREEDRALPSLGIKSREG
jgi:hypothetical protein